MTRRPDGTVVCAPFPDYEKEVPTTGSSTRRVTFSANGQVAVARKKVGSGAAALYSLHTDQLGNVAAVANSAGVYVTDSYAVYEPFGAFLLRPTATNPSVSDRGFTGHRHNNTGTYDFGLIYMNARYYHPQVGRFVSPDTIMNSKLLSNKMLIAFLFAAIIIMLTMWFCRLTSIGCLMWNCSPAREVSIFELSLPPYLFPKGSIINDLHQASESFGAKAAGDMTIYWNSGEGLATYNIRQFATANDATRFQERLENLGRSYDDTTIISFQSQFADKLDIGCGYSEFGGYRCNMTAQYNEFVIYFNSVIDDEMSIKQFEEALKYIDTLVGDRLEQ